MGVLICASVEEAVVAALVDGGPRRDFLELAAATGARVVYRDGGGRKGGWRGRLAGPHVRHAWKVAKTAGNGDVIFADGEHVGIPVALFLRLRRRRARVVMLGHFVSKPWKRALLAMASRLGVAGSLLVHSKRQFESATAVIGHRWTVELVPYQVDTAYWTRPGDRGAVVLAVGAESRDYDTLGHAVRGLGADVRIAAGSHWARKAAVVAEGDACVTWITEALPFAPLRDEYRQAACVVVPLRDVPNQSGVTTILEAMSLALPVVVTATGGQLEVVRGPLVTGAGIDERSTAERGPGAFGAGVTDGSTGFYVPPADPPALQRAISMLLDDRELAERLGRAGRDAAHRHFSVEGYVARLAAAIREQQRRVEGPAPRGVRA